MSYALCIALFIAGHIVRDGWPAWKDILAPTLGTRWEWLYHLSTQWARLSGGLICTLGAAAVLPWELALAVGAAVTLGYWTDQKHGEGQGAGAWHDVPYLLLSGTTSLIPLSLVAAGHPFALHGDILIVSFVPVVLFFGLVKPPIWFVSWYFLRPHETVDWWEPTRIAAGVFGGVIGGIVCLWSILGLAPSFALW